VGGRLQVLGENAHRFAARALALAGASASWLLAAPPASAQCGGICLYELGTPQMGNSSAGAVAEASDASTAFYNPAGMSRIERGELIAGLYGALIDLEFDADRAETSSPPGGFTNDGGNLGGFAPGLASYAVMPLADELGPLEDLRFGMSLNGLFGGAASYRDSWIGRFFITDVSLLVLNAQPGFSARLADWLSVGASANVLYGRLSEYQLMGPAEVGKLKADGADDFEPSFTLGVLLEPCEGTRVGATYRYEAALSLTGGDARNFQYDFTLPQGFNVALHQQLGERLALLLDAGWSDWSEYSQQSIVVGPVDVSFDRRWRDTWRVATGLVFEPDERWTLRTGFAYDSSPVKASRRTPDLPVGEQYRISAGVQRAVGESLTLGFSYTFLWLGNPGVRQVAIPPRLLGVVLDGEYEPSMVHTFGLTLQWRFCSPLPWVACPEAAKAS
jgi:long-chain fatty acid transport protein